MLLLRLLMCRRLFRQLLLQRLPSADLSCQLDVERRLAFRGADLCRLPVGGRPLFGTLHGDLRFRESLFERAADIHRLCEFRVVLGLTVGEVRRRCRQLRNMPLLRRLTRQVLVGDLLLQRLAFALLLSELCLECGLTFFGTLALGGGPLFGALPRQLGFRELLLEATANRDGLCQSRLVLGLAIGEMCRRLSELQRVLLLRVLTCRHLFCQLVLERLPSADLSRQFGVESALALRGAHLCGLSFGSRAFFGALHRGCCFREFLFQATAKGRRLCQAGVVLSLTIGERRRCCRQLRDVALLRRLTRQLLVGDLLLQRLAFAQLLRQLCLE